nr:RNA-dependent RNA polymerase [Tolivirales sp.]
MLSPNSALGVNNGDIHTLRTALLERMYYCKVGSEFVEPPVISASTIRVGLKDFRARLVDRFQTTPSSPQEVVDMYRGRKRTIYEKAMEEFISRDVTRKDSIINAFVKCEKVKTTGAPRCIQPRYPVYNLAVGRYIKKVEHRIYRRIAKIFGDGPTVMKGYTVQGVAKVMRGKWDSFADPVAIGLDATKFDMHVCEGMLKWEHSIYEAIYSNYGAAELRRLLSWQRSNIGRGRAENGRLWYKVKGRRASGDMNTALGNCIIMCALIWQYSRERGVPVKLVNNGDDCVVFMERRHAEQFSKDLDAWFYGYGFRMTKEPLVDEFERIEFCQMHPILTKSGWTMVRNIGVALQKDTMCTMPLNYRSARKWMYAVGECGLALTTGVPIMQEFYSAYMRNGDPSGNIANSPIMLTGLSMMRGDLVCTRARVSDEARLSVFTAWGITPDEQIALESYFSSWTFTDQVDSNYVDQIPTLLHVF